jgi:ubiquinone/menaquinone biosynthesis C-methylase UbiE
VALDLSGGMLRHAAALGRSTGAAVPLVQADAAALPFRDGAFDLAARRSAPCRSWPIPGR